MNMIALMEMCGAIAIIVLFFATVLTFFFEHRILRNIQYIAIAIVVVALFATSGNIKSKVSREEPALWTGGIEEKI